MNIHGDIVEFYAVDDFAQPLVIINGTEVPVGNAIIPLPNGGTVRLADKHASASWVDGTSVTAQLHTSVSGGFRLAGDVRVRLPASRWNTVQGLMGNNDNERLNDLRLRDGTRLNLDPNLPEAQLTQALYSGPFRSSWLVQSGESLFSRGVNRFDPFYPTSVVKLEDLNPALVAMAQQVCQAEGVLTAEVLSRCILDVAITDDAVFAQFAAAVDPQIRAIAVSPRALYFTSSSARELMADIRGSGDRSVIWSSTGGSVSGSVSGSGQTASYTPPAEHGTYTITATLAVDPSVSDTVQVVVGTPLVIAPNEVLLGAGETQTFTAFGAEGQSVVWSTSEGSIQGSGRTVTYTTPVRAGTYTVTAHLAVDPNVRATATVKVYGSQLSPFVAIIIPNESREFTWLNAESLEPTWSATGGYLTGSGHRVTYTAPALEGEYTITASLGSDSAISATATVLVLAELPIHLISATSDGSPGNRSSAFPGISADGRLVAFLSQASDLIDGDTNDAADVFLRDILQATTERVSVAADGTQGYVDNSFHPAMTPDGRYVAFTSSAHMLISNDWQNTYRTDIFLKDMQTGNVRRISLAQDGTAANNDSGAPAISADGRYVVFESFASNLVPGDTNNRRDIFLKDVETGSIQRISVSADSTEANNSSSFADISADGRFVVFSSHASNLVSDDTNGVSDIFLRDLAVGTLQRISVAGDGTESNGSSYGPRISADGRYITFTSHASNLGFESYGQDIYVKDIVTGTLALVSAAMDRSPANDYSEHSNISADGRYIAFASSATNLTPLPTYGYANVYRVQNPLWRGQ